MAPVVQFEGDLGEILTLRAEISPYIGLREKWESSLKKKIFFFFSFHLAITHHRQITRGPMVL